VGLLTGHLRQLGQFGTDRVVDVETPADRVGAEIEDGRALVTGARRHGE